MMNKISKNKNGPLIRSKLLRNFFYTVALIVLLAALVGIYHYFVRTTTGRYLDQIAFRQARLIQNKFVNGSSEFLSYLPMISLIIAIAVAVISLVRNPYKQQISRVTLIFLSMGAANISTRLLKRYIFDRPDVGIEDWLSNSLPSGHTTLAASSAAAIFLMVSARWRPLISFLGGSYAIFAGVSTILNMWHRPSDVIAAFFVVAVWGLLCSWMIISFPHVFNPPEKSYHTRVLSSSFIWITLSLALGIVPVAILLDKLVSIATLTPEDLDTLLYAMPSSTSFFWGGVSLVSLSGYLLVAGSIAWSDFLGTADYPLPKNSFTVHSRRKNRR